MTQAGQVTKLRLIDLMDIFVDASEWKDIVKAECGLGVQQLTPTSQLQSLPLNDQSNEFILLQFE